MRTWKTHGSSYNAVKQGTVRRPGFQCLLCPRLRCDPQNLPSQAHLTPPLQSDGSYQCMHPLSQHPLFGPLFSCLSPDTYPSQARMPLWEAFLEAFRGFQEHPQLVFIQPFITGSLSAFCEFTLTSPIVNWGQGSLFSPCLYTVCPEVDLTIKLTKLRLRALGSWGLFQGPGRARGIITLLVLSSL